MSTKLIEYNSEYEELVVYGCYTALRPDSSIKFVCLRSETFIDKWWLEDQEEAETFNSIKETLIIHSFSSVCIAGTV